MTGSSRRMITASREQEGEADKGKRMTEICQVWDLIRDQFCFSTAGDLQRWYWSRYTQSTRLLYTSIVFT